MVGDDELSTEEARQALVQKIGENIGVRRASLVTADSGVVGSYVHGNNRIAVLVELRGGDQDLARDVALARAFCAEHGMEVGTWGVQLLGGHGYVTDHPVELWYRHLRAVGLLDGVVLV